jgi:hypothetical protein
LTGFARHLFDDDLISCGNAVLLAARAHNCEHGFHHFSLKLATAQKTTPKVNPLRGKPVR